MKTPEAPQNTPKPFKAKQETILGVLETACFIRRGPQRFGNTIQDAALSFCTFLLLYPYNLVMLYFFHAEDPSINTKITFEALGANFFYAQINMSISVILMFVIFGKIFNKNKNIFQLITAINWSNLITATLFVFPLFLIILGFHKFTEIGYFSIGLSFYEFALNAFIIKHSFKTHYFGAVFLAIMIFIFQQIALVSALPIPDIR